MGETTADLKTEDGVCECHIFHPEGAGSWPAVILYMDGLGIRPDLLQMGRRLGSNGYYALVPNLFYRAGKYAPFNPATAMTDEAEQKRLMGLIQSVSNPRVMKDTAVFLDFLDKQPQAKASKVGCVGYCMGGSLTLSAAGTYPDRIAAAASIHGANLANDRPDSPHQLAGKMRGKVYVGVAEIDPWLTPGETDRLKATLEASKVNHTVEIYPKVQHGFAVDGTPMYDRAAAELHWQRILQLFRETLA